MADKTQVLVPPHGNQTKFRDIGGGDYAEVKGAHLGMGASVALTAPAAALSASANTTFTFASQINHLCVQNNSGTTCGVAFDGVATAGSLQVASGQTLLLDVSLTTLGVYSTAASPVNLTAGSNVVILGWQ